MEPNGGDVIANVMQSQGVRYLFTLCGGHISPVLVGSKRTGIRVVDVRDEASAVFAADATARLTGTPGVAAVTAGPGVTNAITALKNAQMAQTPLVLIGGAAATMLKGRGSLQDIDQIALLQSIVKTAVTINRNCDIVPVFEHAFRICRSDVPGPVFVECPIDILYGEELVRSWYGAKSGAGQTRGLKSRLFQFYLNRHLDRMFACDFDQLQPPDPSPKSPAGSGTFDVDSVVSILKDARRPVMIIGSQAMLFPDRVADLAAAVIRLNLPVFLTGMARGLLGSSNALHIRHKRKAALQAADVVIIAGMPCDFRLDYGRGINSRAKLISVNRSRSDLHLNRKPTLAIHADPFGFLCALGNADLAISGRWAKWLDSLHQTDLLREEEITAMGSEALEAVNPIGFLRRLDAFLTDSNVLVADGGDFVATAAYVLRPRGPLRWLDPGVFGTLGVGGGFAVGAQVCRPDSEVWLLYGDGAAGYSLQEFDTFVRHKLPVIAVVGNDASWAQIARDQVEILSDDIGTVLRPTDYHTVAEGYGGKGFLIRSEGQIEPMLRSARKWAQKGVPVLLNVLLSKTEFRKGSISM